MNGTAAKYGQDPEDWTNLGVCRYYGLDSVAVKK